MHPQDRSFWEGNTGEIPNPADGMAGMAAFVGMEPLGLGQLFEVNTSIFYGQ